ncbi:MAG: hypothetical protein LQ350_001006 [Teloschistes chrysophthalmus]|nr:MAG: hypothetical protein LQ350_001006 [Niorma chrysophthalma]
MALYRGALALSNAGANPLKPCREFRLLLLFLGETTEHLHGELIRSSIDDADIHYTALSYAWGDPSNSGVIVLNGGYEMSITRNLEAALRQFRSRTECTRLWVDAICINQADDDEKGRHVAMMRSFYLSVSSTWVWLGTSNAGSDSAMDIAQSFLSEDFTDDDFWLIKRESWRGVTDLLRRSWWTRIWVIQEVLSSRQIHVWCGSKRIDFECFVKLIQTSLGLDISVARRQPFLNILNNWTRIRNHVSNGGASLLQLIASTQNFESTLRCDKIYALLAISSEDTRAAIIPDYSYRTTDSLLCTRVTAHLLMQWRCLLPLHLRFYRKADDLTLPSWVPDLLTLPAEYNRPLFSRKYNACGPYWSMTPRFLPEFTHPSSCLEDASLILKGVVVDQVDIVEPMPEIPTYTGPDIDEYLKSLKFRRELVRSTCGGWLTIVNAYFLNKHTDAPAEHSLHHTAFWRTIIADRLYKATGPPGPESSQHFQDWQADMDSKEATDFRDAAVLHCACKSFILTDAGRLGLALSTARTGDLVCLLHGGNMPFMLRCEDKRNGCYRFVGDAYVHGIMQGEASEKLGGDEVQEFELV